MATTPKQQTDSRLNETITKLSTEVHILNTSLNLGENSDVIIMDCLERILSLTLMIKDPYDRLQQHVSDFDCSRHIESNGFRSLCYLAERSVDLITTTVGKYKQSRNTFFFNNLHFEHKFQNIRDLLCTIYFMLKLGEKILLNRLDKNNPYNQRNTTNTHNNNNTHFSHNSNTSINSNNSMTNNSHSNPDIEPSNSLFVNVNDPMNKILFETDLFVDKVVYGNLLAFNYKDSLKTPMNNVANAMAGFADAHDKSSNKFGRAVSAIAFSSIYSNNKEKRGERLKSLLTNPSIEFVKSFWSLTEDYKLTILTDLMGPYLAIDNSLQIPTNEIIALPLTSNENSTFVIKPPPNKSFINARIYCSKLREGHKTLKDKKSLDSFFPQGPEPNSDNLLFHCPGGGFLAQTPKSHGIYLKNWAKKINVPIISIDYSKAPQAPFPSAVDECFYAYCWALQNHNMLGSTAKRIGIVGDSSGGNLIYGVVNKAIEAGIRVPDFIVAVYPVLSLEFTITPSRLLSICDILLSTGVLKLCLLSYISDNEEELNACVQTMQDIPIEINDESYETIEPTMHDISAVLTPSSMKNDDKFICKNDEVFINNDEIKTTISASDEHPSTQTPKKSALKHIQKYQNRMKETQLKTGMIVNSLFSANIPGDSAIMIDTGGMAAGSDTSMNKNGPQASAEMLFLQQQYGWTEIKKRVCRHHHISPFFTPDYIIKKFPKSYIIVSNCDPLLDDSVEFCKKLKKNNAPFELKVVEGLPHGFLQFSFVSNDASDANDYILRWLKSEFDNKKS